MRTEIIEILQKKYPEYCMQHIDTADEILRLISVVGQSEKLVRLMIFKLKQRIVQLESELTKIQLKNGKLPIPVVSVPLPSDDEIKLKDNGFGAMETALNKLKGNEL